MGICNDSSGDAATRIELLKQYHEEIMKTQPNWKCTECNESNCFLNRQLIVNTPQMLIIQIHAQPSSTYKRNAPIVEGAAHEGDQMLAPLEIRLRGVVYDLQAASSNVGIGGKQNHFIAYAQDKATGQSMRLDDAKETTIHPHEYIAKQPVNMAIYTRRTLTVPCSTMIKLTPNSKIEEQVVQRVHDGAKVYRTHTSDLFWQDAETAESGLRALAHAIEQSKKPGNKNPPSASQHLTTKDKGQTQANKAQGEPKETSTLGEAACSICAQLSPKPNPTRTLECRPQGNRPKGYCWVNNKGWLKYAEGDDPNSLLGTAIEHDFGPPHGKCRGRIVSIIKSETEAETTLYHAKTVSGWGL